MDEKTCSAWHAKEMAHKTTGKVAQVRVMQGKEPAHFSMIFKGMMIIHKGGHSSALKQVAPSARTDSTGSAGGGMSDMASLNMLRQGGVSKKSDGSALFRVHGTTTVNTRTVEVTKKALELNSDDCFIAINDSSLFVWCGRGSNPTERKAAQIVSDVLSHNYHSVSTKRKFEVIEEGKEPAEFWTLLGGKGMYPESGPGAPLPKDPLLFVCSDSSGSFKVEEVPQFTQSDLNDEDVFLLDTFCTIFVWLGSQSNQHEKDKSLNTAKLFATQCNDGRDPNCPIVIVDAGTEPSMFTTHFVPWDEQMSERNKFVDPYEEKLRAIRRRSFPTDINGVATSLQEASVSNDSEPIVYITGYFPFKDVKAGSIPGMNLQARETYLDDETFKEKLGVDRDTFNAMPRWKRDQKKKDIGIF